MQKHSYSIMIHGGAGTLDRIASGNEAIKYRASMRRILELGRDLLEHGGSALAAVERCTVHLEDDPLFNAGCGSVLNAKGQVEMDAAIMDGKDLAAGAVAAVHNIANPVHLARLVMAESEYVLLSNEGARQFAEHYGVKPMPDEYFITDFRLQQLQKVAKEGRVRLHHDASDKDQKYGTVGAVAYDSYGNLAAATSTGGIVNKDFGRVGDSAIIGAGVYADNASCAVSASGYGEDFMRTVLAKTVADLIEFQQLNADQATIKGMQYLTDKVTGRGGIIVIDHNGACASGFTSKRMLRGWIEQGGDTICTF